MDLSESVTNYQPAETDSENRPQNRSVTNVAVLGTTGSIGTATVDVLQNLNRLDPQSGWRLWAASGHRNVDGLLEIVETLAADPDHGSSPIDRGVTPGCNDSRRIPERLVFSDRQAVSEPSALDRLGRAGLDRSNVRFGPDALVDVARADEVDVLVAAIVGRAGLESTVAAVEAGKRVALANKETLVVAGDLVQKKLAQNGGALLPVDSEHSAIFQCIASSHAKPRKLILTASGGPFRSASKSAMAAATPKDALAHPTWQMGPKISIDSATMMNKALEIIEARWLFDVSSDQIEVVIHPQSIIHSMVEFVDGSVLSQMSPPDMRMPIQYALTYPRRLPCPAPELDFRQPSELTLEPADLDRFPALALGFEVARCGGTAGAVVNAANEVAVELFLDEKIRFDQIVPTARKVLECHTFEPSPTLSRLLELDRWARQETRLCTGNVD
ncbi:1-deoxy-D-xylulose-5-phosphate reductoisomerase [Roseiconus lacunae]|uniref:1-deoxy-D-xylulose 5-phosphate reductoisomerase n=1 Tax=Roseiconus lacunae TaxID=2605694 RepID=A0ABT7PQ09_9BACT|nr:1-deoxy-D-xylulose-5-phosphate reductoisomerase [Roseiconus lacunae]MDM4018379.1 1-deoxy-D-xylulose-5-phosphate reductoisomerase [Roseiconus lacunae]